MFVSNLCPYIIRENKRHFKGRFTFPHLYMFIFWVFFHLTSDKMKLLRSYNDHKVPGSGSNIKFNSNLCQVVGFIRVETSPYCQKNEIYRMPTRRRPIAKKNHFRYNVKELPHKRAACLAVPFPPCTSCNFLDLPPASLRNLQARLTDNSLASQPPLLCGISLTTDGTSDASCLCKYL